MARGVIETLRARQGIDRKQFIDPRHDARRHRIPRVELGCFKKLASRVRPTAGMHHLRPAHTFIGDIAVGLQNTFELSKKLSRPLPPAPQPEVENYAASRCAILPKIG